MLDSNELFKEFSLPEINSRREFFVYLKIIFLPVLVFIFFLFGYFNIINFKVELHTIIMMGFILFVALLFARHSAEFGCYVFEQKNNEFKRDLKSYIMKSLLTIGKDTKSNAKFDDFVASYANDVRDDNYASIGAGVFPMLGILGTFLSIAISMPQFNSSDTAALEVEIGKLLSGVGTAFYVSIYGIFLALWWIFFERFGMKRFKRLVNRQKIATNSFFWTKEEIDQKYTQASLESFAKIGKVFEYVSNQEFFEELDKVVERKYNNFTNLLNTEENAIRLSSEHVKQTMNTLTKSQKDHKDLVKIHSEIINVLHSFNQNLKQTQLSFSEQYMRLQSVSEEKLSRLERSISNFGSNILVLESKLEQFSLEILSKQQLALDGFKSGMIDGMNAFREIFDEEATTNNDNSLNMVKELKESINQIDQETNSVIQRIEDAKKGMKSSHEEILNIQNSHENKETTKTPQTQENAHEDK